MVGWLTGVWLAGLSGLGGAAAVAAPPDPALHHAGSSRAGVLVMAHGGNDAWNRAVEAAIHPLEAVYPVEIAWGMARADTLQAALDRLADQGVDEVAVVRLFISGQSFRERTEQILGLAPIPASEHQAGSTNHDTHAEPNNPSGNTGSRTHTGVSGPDDQGGRHDMPVRRVRFSGEIRMSEAGVGEWPLVGEILAERVASLSRDPARESILLLAHGPASDEENEHWLADMARSAARIRSLGPFQAVRAFTLREDWPDKRTRAEERIRAFVAERASRGERVLVVPFRVAGFGPYADVLAGLDYEADGAGLCPHPLMTRWIDEQARALAPHLPPAGQLPLAQP